MITESCSEPAASGGFPETNWTVSFMAQHISGASGDAKPCPQPGKSDAKRGKTGQTGQMGKNRP
jgi:hypothetical protein